ncbi:hypothetical protein K3725_01365 [Leisingera sp. S132]|uniref:hypothetical protein n=1 Tax=Leisingera sp. S132 TaxID=2867016 RepID=UPI0021A71649|nr:hypothetical protein [Leisingera sp. S132]UWQ79690.1 hypothetical protein K3725_01365 [Leisingera sp. S132]
MGIDDGFRAKTFPPSLCSAKAKGRQGVQEAFCLGPGISQSALNTLGLAALKNVPRQGANQPLHKPQEQAGRFKRLPLSASVGVLAFRSTVLEKIFLKKY